MLKPDNIKYTSTIDLDQTYQIAGQHGSYGIQRQIWLTPHGRAIQYAVTIPAPLPGLPFASVRTCVATEAEARAIWAEL